MLAADGEPECAVAHLQGFHGGAAPQPRGAVGESLLDAAVDEVHPRLASSGIPSAGTRQSSSCPSGLRTEQVTSWGPLSPRSPCV